MLSYSMPTAPAHQMLLRPDVGTCQLSDLIKTRFVLWQLIDYTSVCKSFTLIYPQVYNTVNTHPTQFVKFQLLYSASKYSKLTLLPGSYIGEIYLYLGEDNCLNGVNKGHMPKSIYSTYAFSYFTMYMVMMDLFK